MSKSMSVSVSNEIYERLVISAKSMGLTKSAYIAYALKQTFNQEDILNKLPELPDLIKTLNKKLDENGGV